MMGKMSSILLVVAGMFVLVAGDCISDIQGRIQKGKPLIGGYRPVSDPKNDAVVDRIVADAINTYNGGSNEMLKYVDDDHYMCYSQLVNGLNYCCQFQIKSDGCKTAANSEVCQTKRKCVCTVKAYKPFTASNATINQDSLNCTLDAKH